MIDCKKLPIPKYKIGDKVWVANYLSVEEHTITEVHIKGGWFDNGYTSRQEFTIHYETNKHVCQYTENQFYNSKRTAQRVVAKTKLKIRQDSIQSLKEDLKSIRRRCKYFDLTIDDL